jgi:hypothetical protein
MGILDEAIRDHLDLKRRGGAGDSEIERLESEAFGPSSRPGAPGADVSTAGPEAAVAEVARPDVVSGTDELEEAPEAPEATEAPEREAAPENGDGAPPGPPSDVGEPQPGTAFHDLAAEAGLVEPTRSTRAPEEVLEQRQVPPGLEDTQPHDVERELAAEDTGAPDALDLDELDLELEDEAEETPPEPEPPEEPGEPDASVEVIEEGTEEQVVEPVEESTDEEAAGEESGEDVLEETPEFLRDTPESDRLWFEQGEPKDFDFEDEEE